jgi:hypothetical protein
MRRFQAGWDWVAVSATATSCTWAALALVEALAGRYASIIAGYAILFAAGFVFIWQKRK